MRFYPAIIMLLCGAGLLDAQTICDIGAAREYCDTTALQRVEGIWEMTTDGMQVLIHKDDAQRHSYRITVLSSEDSRILPGSTLGMLKGSADPDQFLLTLETGMKWNAECLATLAEKDMVIRIERPKTRIKFSPNMFLRRLWSILRVETERPADRITNGLLRIYPHGIEDRGNPFHITYF